MSRSRYTGMAKKYLKSYRVWRRQGYSVRQARSIALFGICCMSRGRSNLLGQAHARQAERRYWGKVHTPNTLDK